MSCRVRCRYVVKKVEIIVVQTGCRSANSYWGERRGAKKDSKVLDVCSALGGPAAILQGYIAALSLG